jgi:predicted transcriptional regulator
MTQNRNTPKPTDAELEILAVLWEYGPSTVRFVNERLNERREVGYTTTLKFLQIMSEKGLVSRNTEGRTHIYEAALGKEKVQEQLINKLVDTAFGGSAQNLVMQALGRSKSSKEELEAIKAYITKLEGGRS